MAQIVKNPPTVQETWVRSLGREDPLEEGMATCSSILAWRIPRERSLVGYNLWGHKEPDTTEGPTLSLLTQECSPGSAPASSEICWKLKLGSLAHPKSHPCALTSSPSDPHTHSSVVSNSFSNYRFTISCTSSGFPWWLR